MRDNTESIANGQINDIHCSPIFHKGRHSTVEGCQVDQEYFPLYKSVLTAYIHLLALNVLVPRISCSITFQGIEVRLTGLWFPIPTLYPFLHKKRHKRLCRFAASIIRALLLTSLLSASHIRLTTVSCLAHPLPPWFCKSHVYSSQLSSKEWVQVFFPEKQPIHPLDPFNSWSIYYCGFILYLLFKSQIIIIILKSTYIQMEPKHLELYYIG